MNNQQILENIISVEPNNQFLKYIVDRIQDVNYRGIHISQHNRYDFDRLVRILKGIYDVVSSNRFRVPLGDDTVGFRDNDCDDYYNIVISVKNKAEVGSINSLKKNFFVDFDRMGLLYRLNEHCIQITGRGHVYYAQLTDRAINLLQSQSITERYKIFTDALDMLFANNITNLAELLYDSKYRNDAIGIYEFMLILSDDRPNINSKIELIDSFRNLKRYQQDKALKLIKDYCNPDNFIGNKNDKRDFGNWKNESQQIFTLLKSTVYFDICENSLKLNTGIYGIFSETHIKQRRIGSKRDYFIKHRIDKMRDFELHHIIPFSSARNKEEFSIIDHWKNLIYLNQDKHNEISRKKDKNILLTAKEYEISLETLDHSNKISARNGVSALYNGSKASIMQKYNREILKNVFKYIEN
ncbi:MAG: hypothetical protein FJ216_11810 [Ignavibacteria bacterium]|nr:hypothetical protein [Ignavibacteria bacterium]